MTGLSKEGGSTVAERGVAQVSLRGVGKQFGSSIAVQGLSVDVPEQRFITLLGPSGCGKTTILRMIAGLEVPDSGIISIGGRVVSDPTAGILLPPERRSLGMVFQSYAVWPHMTVWENVAYPLQVRRVGRAETERRVAAELKRMGLNDMAGRGATRLSGGQQQRVAIARALVCEPQVLLMDEPFSNLDSGLREQMAVELKELQRQLGLTTIYVTHDQSEAMVLSETVMVLDAGRVMQLGDPETIYLQPANAFVATFLGCTSLLPAEVERVLGEAEGQTRLIAAGRGWSGECRGEHGLRPGDRGWLVVRAESARLGLVAERGVELTGRVVARTFRGDRQRYHLQVGDTTIQFDVPGRSEGLAAGSEVVVHLGSEDAWIVPANVEKGNLANTSAGDSTDGKGG